MQSSVHLLFPSFDTMRTKPFSFRRLSYTDAFVMKPLERALKRMESFKTRDISSNNICDIKLFPYDKKCFTEI